jgi:hypothetical protein
MSNFCTSDEHQKTPDEHKKNDSRLANWCFFGAFLGKNCGQAGAKFVLIWCKIRAHLDLFFPSKLCS